MVQYFPEVTGSLTINGSLSVSGPMSITGSIAGTSSLASNALLLSGTGSVGFATTGAFIATSSSLSSRTTQIESVYATTGSNSFRATQSITGSLTVTGQIIAQTLNVQQVTSSIVFSSGSNTFGCDLNSRQTFTGSVIMTGSLIVNTTGPELQVNNNGVILGNLTTDRHGVTGSFYQLGPIAGFSGSVGIGTNNPWGKFDVNAGPGMSFVVQDSGITNTIELTNYSSACGLRNIVLIGSTLSFTTAVAGAGSGTERMRITSCGNVGIGTSSPSSLLDVRGTATYDFISISNGSTSGGGGILTRQNGTASSWFGNSGGWEGGTSNDTGIGSYAGGIRFYTNGGTEKMRITSGGNVAIGGTDSGEKLNIITGNIKLYSYQNVSGEYRYIGTEYAQGNGNNRAEVRFGIDSSDTRTFVSIATAASGGTITERMRVNASGYVKMSDNGSYVSVNDSFYEMLASANNTDLLYMMHRGTSPYGYELQFSNAAPNNTTNWFSYFYDNSTLRFSVRSNGGIANFQGNNVNLSDQRVKKDISPLESYWDKFKQIEIVKFKYKDQTHDDFNIGVIAQQVESVAPEFVDVDGWDNKPKLDEDGNEIASNEQPLKSIYTADLHHATIKVLQEAMAKIEELTQKVNELENK